MKCFKLFKDKTTKSPDLIVLLNGDGKKDWLFGY